MAENLGASSTIVDAGFDYLTLSINHRKHDRAEFLAFAEETLLTMQDYGYANKPRKVMQYDGVGNDSFFYGTDGHYDLLRVSGQEAKEVADELRRRKLYAKPTRCDFQLTTGNGCRDADFAQQIVRTLRCDEGRIEKPRKQAIASFSGPVRDTGLTIGSRKSETYIRVYDAHRKHPVRYAPYTRRVETEYKGEKAINAYAKFILHGEQALLSQSLNAGELTKRGIVEDWMLEVIPSIPAGVTVKSTNEKRLWWLANQVVPVVKKLMQTEHAEYIRAIFLDAVGPQCVTKRRYTTPEKRLYDVNDS